MTSDTDAHTADENTPLPAPPFYRPWFINRFGHLRALWRIALFMVVGFLLVMGIRWLVNLAPFPDEGDVLLTWKGFVQRIGISLGVILAAFAVLKWIDRRPTALLGLNLSDGWRRDFVLGLIIGAVTISVTLGCLWLGGWVSLSLNDLTIALFVGVSKALLFFLVAALIEELLLRGYPLQAFIEGSRVWIAVVLLSCVFSVLHFNNPDATIPSAMNIFLAGVLLSVAYLKTRSLWLPTGLHLGWNWAQASFWGLGVSGYHVEWSVFAAEAHGADWISGGKFGAEASVFATVVISLATFLIWRTDKLGVSERLATAWRAFPQGYGLPPKSEETQVDESE